ncbi:MAG: DNA cytosine methyltransferase [bacterium]|nr:DNA cytosine methyltransferase [bacterium]
MPAEMDHPLHTLERPEFEQGNPPVRIVDLFCGCGGLTLGVAQAANVSGYRVEIPLAVDFDSAAISLFGANFPKADTRCVDVEELFDGNVGKRATRGEEELADRLGTVDYLVGGPPCQGHSDLNNHTRRDDPKNEYYVRMARAAEVLRPRAVLIENVPAVVHSRLDVVNASRDVLRSAGYAVSDRVVRLERLSVPQRRKRHVLIAVRDLRDADAILKGLEDASAPAHDLRWAIGDLSTVEEPTGTDRPPRASDENLERMRWMLRNDVYDLPNRLRPRCHRDKEHSYRSMYGRLRWDLPAQTITSGFGSIGQGRYMHPEHPRALTPHEAARLQGFPDYFSFDGISRRAELATIIGNTAPPPLGNAFFTAVEAATRDHVGAPG